MTKDRWITLGAVATVTAAVTLLVYLPQSRELEDLRVRTATGRVALDEDTSKAAVIPVMIEHIEAMKLRYKDFDRAMPKRKELAGFLTEISHVLDTEELSNQLTKPGNPTREELFHTLPIIMEFQGQYLSLASLLERFNQMERLTRIQKLVITRNPRSEDLNIQLQMNIYFTET